MLELSGIVIEGDGVAGTLGYPTANLELTSDEPDDGVYAGLVLLDEGELPAVAIIGVDDKSEVHILDWEGDLYGKTITVTLIDKIRDINAYNSTANLVTQIEQDIASARQLIEIHV